MMHRDVGVPPVSPGERRASPPAPLGQLASRDVRNIPNYAIRTPSVIDRNATGPDIVLPPTPTQPSTTVSTPKPEPIRSQRKRLAIALQKAARPRKSSSEDVRVTRVGKPDARLETQAVPRRLDASCGSVRRRRPASVRLPHPRHLAPPSARKFRDLLNAKTRQRSVDPIEKHARDIPNTHDRRDSEAHNAQSA